MSKSKQVVSEFEMALRKRSSSFGEDGAPSYPFMFGYLVGLLQELAENHPKVAKKIALRTEMIHESLEQPK